MSEDSTEALRRTLGSEAAEATTVGGSSASAVSYAPPWVNLHERG